MNTDILTNGSTVKKKFAKGMGSWRRDRFIYRSMGVPMLAKCWSVLRHCIER